MKRLTVFIFFSCLIFFSADILFGAPILSTDGFSEMKWGEDISVFSDLKHTSGNAKLKTYIKNSDEDKIINGVKFSSVGYYFYENKFFGVDLVTNKGDLENAEFLLESLKKSLGLPKGVSNSRGFFWDLPNIGVQCSLRSDGASYHVICMTKEVAAALISENKSSDISNE